MSEEYDVQCKALGCCEPRRDDRVEFCLNHEQQVLAFGRWLEGTDEGCWPTVRSFDHERYFWTGRSRPV